MVMTKQEILDYKTYLVDDLYANLNRERAKDQEFYDDTFKVPQLAPKNRPELPVSRTGKGARLVDSPAEHIITTNPQAFKRDVISEKDQVKTNRVLSMLNQQWIPLLKRQNPNPFKESARKILLRGDSWLQLAHNSSWVTGEIEKLGLPVLFLMPDPMTVYADPEEHNGIPKRVIVWCERMPWLVKQIFDKWSNPLNKKPTDKVNYLAYFDDDVRYFEADGEPLLKDEIQENLYGFPPFIHATSGFGYQSSTGEPADLIVGRLRKVRDLLIRLTAITSSIDAVIYLMAQPHTDFRTTVDRVYGKEAFTDYERGLATYNVLPYGVEPVPSPPVPQLGDLFRYLAVIESSLEREDPRVLAGIPAGTSGRQQDIVGASAMMRYETVAENIEAQFSTGIDMSLQMLKAVPGLMPDEIKETDIDTGYYIKLKAEDPLDIERKATLGSRLYAQKEIDLMTNLVEYQGKTPDRGKEIITNILVDLVTINNPLWAEMAGEAAAEEMGMEKYLEEIKQRTARQTQQQQGLQAPPSPSEMQRVTGEVMTPEGREMIDEALRTKGGRRPPQAYFRGGA